jgi:hypothetical protein
MVGLIVIFAAILGCTTDGPVAVRQGTRLVRAGGQLGH